MAPINELYQAEAAAKGAGLRARVSPVLKDLALLVLVGILAVTTWRGPLIYYVADHGPGITPPGVVPEEMALNFAERWAQLRYTFVPETFKAQVATLLPWLHPSLRSRFQKDAEDEEREVRKVKVSSQVAVVQRDLLKRDGNTFVVAVTAIRTVWIGSAPPRTESMRAEVTLMPWSQPTRQGQLIVTRSHFTPLFSAAGS